MRPFPFCLLLAAALSLPAAAQQSAEEAFFQSRSRAMAGDAAGAAAALEKAGEMGEGFMPPRGDFARVWDDPAFAAVRSKLEAKLPRLDFAPNAFEVDDRGLIPEGIAWDPYSKSFFMGSIARRKIVRIGGSNEVSTFADAGLETVLGLAVDAPRRILYAVSTNGQLQEGREKPRNAIVAYDVDNGRLLRRVEVPEARQLNDVAVAPGGRIFTTDSASGAVYEIPPQGSVRVLVGPGQLRGSNGLAPSADGKRLYIAHATGLAVVDIAGGPVRLLANRTRETVAAIDGLYAWQGQLIGVQNVTNPGRVIVVTLSPDGLAVTRVQTLLSHHHNVLDEPTTGVVTDHGFFLLAATGVARVGADGKVRDPDTAPVPTVVRVPLPR